MAETSASTRDEARPRGKKQKKRKRPSGEEGDGEMTPGVVYVGHVPHGFYEQEMRAYFSQFGTVKRLRLARSKKTGRSKGYAFVEFGCQEVAAIVASTMNNYLMFDKLLKVSIVEPERVNRAMFRRGPTREFPLDARLKKAQRYFNQGYSEGQRSRRVERLLEEETGKREKLAELGVSYDFPGYRQCAAGSTAPSHILFAEPQPQCDEAE